MLVFSYDLDRHVCFVVLVQLPIGPKVVPVWGYLIDF